MKSIKEDTAERIACIAAPSIKKQNKTKQKKQP